MTAKRTMTLQRASATNYLVAILLCLCLSMSLNTAAAFCPPQSSAKKTFNQHRLTTLSSTRSNIEDTTIADIEEITTFATDNGVELSFTTTGPGYRGVAVSKNDPENILGYIEGFIRPSGKILHADKMEIFKGALSSARREEQTFSGGGTFLGPGLLIAFVCLLHGKESGCEMCEFLAIDDADFQHKRLMRYYRTAGFREVRYVGEELKDIPDRLVWGGCGMLMTESIDSILLKWTRIIRAGRAKMEE
mmetsp:Transcript_20939/g.45402  ORF Transcript_20939/g.45402 Transcript_20939/m.45402 type:complete len:248 (-) Transcript_20939:75-818(-)|eukprot:CAMPEP_0172323738 /NCGR_PEP_ID=MMETSP1058-20130122/49456_1 /TAXON_ID=83371 /ORGANISM="Detonula confervacea, Strain CCMP 353" /LENGTH=247 /DNA_ID=CAMNT_0013039817 /DNA_START=88 /DNA_END=831 /DNA_ORIENTATION=-